MIVVWVEEIPEVMIASNTIQLRPLPSTLSATLLNSAVSSSNSSTRATPAKERTATVTRT